MLIIQDDQFDATESITICPLTTYDAGTKHARAPVEPDADNCLRQPSMAMTDKIATLPRGRLGKRLGTLKPTAMAPINQAILVFLGLAG